jgi:RimJ/RimL family protein N-acetyltransferase
MNDKFQGSKYIGEIENLAIRIATTEDAKILCKWWSDGKVMAHAGFPNGIETDIKELRERISKEEDNYRRLIIEIDSTSVGEMSFRINDNSAEIGIKICDFSYQEKGFGTKAIKLLINYLFVDRSVDKITLDTNLKNTRAQHVYEKIGFRKVKVSIDSWKDQVGVMQSFVDYELLRENYFG